MSDPLGPVTIGAREIYDAVIALTGQLKEVRGDLRRQEDAHAVQVARVAEDRRHVNERMAGYASRLRAVEKRVWALPSASLIVAVLAVVVSAAALRNG